MTKIRQIENHLKEHGSITSWEAIQKYRATRLSAIIFTLKERGMVIESKWERSTNEDGVEIPYVRYVLITE